MRRRDFIAALGGAAAMPLAARAQQAKPVVGLLAGGTAKAYAQLLSAFLQGLNGTGYVEGRSVAIEQRWAEGNYQRLPALADDLVQRQVSVLVALRRRRRWPQRRRPGRSQWCSPPSAIRFSLVWSAV